MKLKEVRKLAIKYCEENNCNYTYISHDNTTDEFYLTDIEDEYTVFLVNKNGSLDSYHSTKYTTDFHKAFKRRENKRRNNDKRRMVEMYNSDYENSDYEYEEEW